MMKKYLLLFPEKPSEIVIQRVGDGGQDDILASAGTLTYKPLLSLSHTHTFEHAYTHPLPLQHIHPCIY